MRRAFVVLGGLMAGLVAGRGDIVLNEGQSYTHEFHIPQLEPLAGEFWVPNAHFFFGVDPASMDPELDEVVVEAFENSTNDVPFFTRTGSSASGLGETVSGSPVHWSEDFQGVVRLRVLRGSVVLSSVSCGLITRAGSHGFASYNHTQLLPVPPPQPPPPVVVNEGESFTHEFHISRLEPLAAGFWVPNAHHSFFPVPDTFDPAVDAVLVEAFENSTNEAPFYSSTTFLDATVPGTPPHWLDLQGVLRFTVTKGSVTLGSLSYGLITRSGVGGEFSSYNNTVVLPLPQVLVRRAPGQVGLRWPAGFADWVLESAPAPSRNVSWTTVSASRVRLGDDWSVLVPNAGSPQFFRLRKVVGPIIGTGQ